MTTNRTTARIVGVLYIIGTAAGILSLVLSQPLREAPDPLAAAAANANQLIVAALFALLMALSLAMVPIVMYPLLKRQSEVLALGYVVFRGAIETVTAFIVPIAWLLLVAVGQSNIQAGTAAAPGIQASGALLLKVGGGNSVGGIIFCLGALMFYWLLYRSRLVPRWISVWGLASLIPYLAAEFLALFLLLDPVSSTATLLCASLALQEMVLAVWLIVVGFSPSAGFTKSGKAQTNALLRAS